MRLSISADRADTSIEGYPVDPERPNLRTADEAGTEAADSPGAPPPAFGAVNPQAELVADLLASTGLLSEDKIDVVRGAAGQSGSLAQAIVDEGFAASE